MGPAVGRDFVEVVVVDRDYIVGRGSEVGMGCSDRGFVGVGKGCFDTDYFGMDCSGMGCSDRGSGRGFVDKGYCSGMDSADSHYCRTCWEVAVACSEVGFVNSSSSV